MITATKDKPSGGRNQKAGHDRLLKSRPICFLKPSPENERLYKPVRPDDPEIIELAKSIEKHGLIEPIVITLDDYIISGHRRFCAAQLAGLDRVPVRIENYRRKDDPDHHTVRLRECNRQRDKTRDEKLREELVTANPDEAYRALLAHREEQSAVDVQSMRLGAGRKRKKISASKMAFADAIVKVVVEMNRQYWPLNDRRVHYLLLNDPPLRHSKKPSSRYRNDERSYKDLTDMLTRLRLEIDDSTGEPRIPMEAIDDETRTVTEWRVYSDPRAFVRKELADVFKGYRRNYQQSQPNRIEIIGEKNTVKTLIEPIAGRYSIPVTTGRGYCSLPPRAGIARRYWNSGKEKLILLVVSDADPEGMDIAAAFGRSMRDEFGIDNIEVVKVALTPEQAREMGLPEDTTAKLTSSRAAKYVEQYGPHVWELEALPPETLKAMVRSAIDSVIDTEAFNAELDAEKADAAWLEGVRRRVHGSLQSVVDEIAGGEL